MQAGLDDPTVTVSATVPVIASDDILTAKKRGYPLTNEPFKMMFIVMIIMV